MGVEKENRGVYFVVVESIELKLGFDIFEGESDECFDIVGGGIC